MESTRQTEELAVRGDEKRDRPGVRMQGTKRDRHGNKRASEQRKAPPPRDVIRNAYTPMFEAFRDELDEHHDRRERIVKASRDVTALSKKIIFSLQRVRKIDPDLPQDVDREVGSRLAEVAVLLAAVAGDVQGVNRWRYLRQLSGIEELVEAVTFCHYLRHQSLMGFDDAAELLAKLCEDGAAPPPADAPADEMQVDAPAAIPLLPDEFVLGLFDLSGELMRFATTSAALTGRLAGAGRTVVADVQALGSFFEMLPQQPDRTWRFKMDTLRASVRKVERVGYGLRVRAGEMPRGWVPDARDSEPSSPV